jgi:HK97 family phage prohead protease
MKDFNIKSVDDSDSHFEGYASTFGNSDREGDVIERGAFDGTLAKTGTIPMLFNHNRDNVIGKLDISKDSKGLRVKGYFNLNDPQASKVYDLIKMGALSAMSIGFAVKDYEPIDPKRPFGSWRIKEADVVETSIVTVPANEQATIDSVKSLAMKDQEIEDIVSKSVRKALELDRKKNKLIEELQK